MTSNLLVSSFRTFTIQQSRMKIMTMGLIRASFGRMQACTANKAWSSFCPTRGIGSHPPQRLLLRYLWPVHPRSPICPFHMSALYCAKKGKKHKAKVDIKSSADSNILDLGAVNSEMQKVLDNLQQEYAKTLTLRTSQGALDHIQVSTKDGKLPLNQLAQISSKSPTTLAINMVNFPTALEAVVKALQDSGMNLNPQVDGSIITVPIPKVTREHREGLAKTAKSICDKAKVSLRQVRGNYYQQIKKSKSDASKDVIFQLEKQLQQVLEDHNSKADDMLAAKAKELTGK